jgi:amino acid adenylation domain-containing protein
MMSRIRDVFQVDLRLQRLFENPTVAGLAAAVMEVKSPSHEDRRIERRKQASPCPLSFAQEQFWLLHQMLPPGSPAYNVEGAISINGAYDASALKGALDELVRRHEILRTSISLSGGQLVQTVSLASDLPLAEVDLSALPELERARQWTRLSHEEGQRPFDLSQLPLLRATVVHHSGQEHTVLLIIHHIVADEWAVGLIRDEVKQLYSAFSEKRSSPLTELPVQYADFACWQRERFEGEKLEEQIAYWKKELEGASPVLTLPTDKPRPPTQTFRGATEHFALPKELQQQLLALCMKEQVTPFMLLEAAFASLLHRYSGQADILVGTPISGRTQSETQRLVGCFLNTVVLRSQFGTGQTFRTLLYQAREQVLGAFAHADLPFGHLVATVTPDRDPSRTPLFQVMFVLHDPDRTSNASTVFVHPRIHNGTSKFDLTLYLSMTEAGLEGIMEYSTDLFEAETVRRMCRHFGVLLEMIARDPDQSVSSLPILTHDDHHQLLVEWNRTKADYPREVPLAQLFEAQAEQSPDVVALVCGPESLSYAELNARANQLAHELRARDAGPDRLVGLFVERSADMVVALLAVVKAGAAYLPLDPLLPRERLSYMLEDSGATLVMTQDSLRPALPAFGGIVISLDDKSWRSNPRDNLAVAVEPEHLAYVIYTSGSTGRPKGVEVPRGALTNFLWSMRNWLGLTTEDRLLAATTISFDIAGLEIWLPLLVGARLVLASRDDAVRGESLRELIDRHGITFLQATPITWRLLLEAGWKGKSEFQAACGGEAMPRDLAAALAPIVRRLWNLYGPTETTIWSTGYLVRDGKQPVLIGRPVANTQCYILDENRQPVPIGVVGELFIGGDGLARGYLRQPELTAEKFLPDPFRSQAGARIYRTGDLARYLADGNIECLGRTDHQVKIRGYRIELGEIEAVVARHGAVRQVVVVVREDAPGDKRLVAYLVADAPPPDLVEQLRAQLRAALPEYMVPQHFVALGSFPTTPNGKIDRKALPAPAAAANQPSTSDARMPRSESERKIAAILCEVLALRSVGLDDDFFDLGGHSLLAVRIVSAINQQFGTSLPVRILFGARTCAQLAREVDLRANREAGAEPELWPILVPIQANGSGTPLFCASRPNVNALGYAILARHLGSEQPVYGLQAQVPEDPQIDFTQQQYEDIAREYIKAMRSVQPRGPYHVIGQCQGAYIAFEMARQIEATGDRFGLLGIIDAWPEQNTRRKWLFALYLLGKALRSRALRILNKIKHASPSANQRGSIEPAASTALVANPGAAQSPDPISTRSLMLKTYFPGRDFKPPVISGKITLFTVGRSEFFRPRDKRKGWGDRTRGGVDVERIPGDHLTLLRGPHSSVLAERIRRLLPTVP